DRINPDGTITLASPDGRKHDTRPPNWPGDGPRLPLHTTADPAPVLPFRHAPEPTTEWNAALRAILNHPDTDPTPEELFEIVLTDDDLAQLDALDQALDTARQAHDADGAQCNRADEAHFRFHRRLALARPARSRPRAA
ncbi:MAG TPA: hypothetical protein VIY72_17745, partial [Acidimicrobiales bacterium]